MKFLVAVVAVGLFISHPTLITTAKMKEEMQYRLKAQELVKRVKYLQEQMNIQSALYNKEIDNINDLHVSPIVKVVPSSTLSHRDESLFVKLDDAIKEYFKTNNPSVEPTCVELEITNKITQTECNEIKDKDINFFKIENSVITYTVDENIKKYLNVLNMLNQVSTDSNTTFKNEVVQTQSSISSKWRDDKIKKLRNEYMQSIKSKNYFLASNLVYKMAYSNPQYALSMIKSLSDTVHADLNTTIIAKTEIFENILASEVIAIKKSKAASLKLYEKENITIDDLPINTSVLNTISFYIGQDDIQKIIDNTKGL